MIAANNSQAKKEYQRAAQMKAAALDRTMEECYAHPEAHPGFLALADTVGGCAARTRGQIPTTIEGKLNHIRAATSKDKKLIGKADVIHFGQKTIVTNVEILNDSGQTLAVGLFTFFALDKSDLKAWL